MAGARIQLKRATAASWASNNPVLYAGEIGLETDTNKFKIGDGTTAFNSLSYFNGNLTGSSLNDLADVTIVSASNGDFLRWNGTAWVNDAVNLSTDTIGSYVESLVAGTGVTLTNNSGEAATPTIAIGQSVSTTASVTFAHVSASVTGNVVGDVTGNADTATTLETARIIELSGDVTGSASFDGSSNINISVTSNPDSITLGTDTTGNYLVDLASGTGVTITHTPGEGSTASVAIGQDVSTTASVTFGQVTVNGQTNVGGHIIPDTTETYDLGSAGARFRDIYLSGTTIDLGGAQITSDGTDVSFSGGINVGGSANFVGDLTGNADTASELETARVIELSGDVTGSVSFDGSQNVNITTTVVNDGVELGVNTTGNYMVDVVGGTGVTVSHTPGEGSSASVAIGQDVATTASVTFVHVAADLTGDVTGNADTATTLQTSRAISLAGDLSGSVSFDGSADVTITATVEPNSVALGTDTTGNFVNDIVAGTGVTVTHTPGEGSSASIAIGQAVGISDNPSFAGLTADNVQIGISGANEIDTVSGNLTIDSAGGTVTLDDDVIITGSLTVSGSATYVNTETLTVDDNIIVLNSNQTGAPSQNAGVEVERGDSNNVAIRWNEANDSWELTEDGTTYRNIAAGQDVETSSSVSFAAVTAPVIGNASTASTLQTARAISLAGDLSGSVSFDGSSDVTITASVEPNSVALGTDTTGNYMVDVVADGSGITVSHTAGEGSSASLSLVQDINTTASVVFAHVSADVTGDLTGNADTASTLATARAISLAGDLSGSVSFDGSSDVTITANVEPNSVALGTDTTGNFVNDVVAGTGVTVTHTPGEGSTASIAIGQDVATTASVTFAAVTAPVIGNASTATTLETSRAISLAGDLSGSVSFNGSQDVTITATVQPNSVALGTDTTGNFVANVVSGTAITVTHTPGEASSASIALNASLNDLNDVVVSAPAEFQALAYDGIGWVPTYTPVVSYVRNAEATTLASGTVVYLFGGNGDHASVKRADNSSDATSSKTVGLMGASVASNNNGPVITRGYVDGIDLSAYSVGDILWLGSNGGLTTTKPSAPKHLVFIGVVVRATINGIVYVATQNGYELEELHDVKVSSVANKDVLMWNSASAVWVNEQINLGTDTVGDYVQNLVAGTGVTLSNNSGEGSTPTVAIGQDVSTSASVVFYNLETTHDLTVGGNLIVSGSVVTENQTSLQIDDPFIYLNGSSSVSNVDLGIAGNYNDGTYRHAGVFRDATDGKFKFFDSYEPEPSSPIDTGHASYSPAPVVAETFESTVTTGTAPFTVASTTEVTNLHADTASSLHTARAISLAGDLSGSVSFDGSGDVTLTATVEPNSVALGTDTTGNYMVGLAEGTGVTIIHTPGEGSTASVSIGQSVATTASVTFAHVSADVTGNLTGDVTGNADTASSLETARAISLAGDLSGSVSFDGSGDVTLTATIGANSVALGTDTTGNYMSDLTQGTGVTITHTPGEGSNATIAIGQAVETSSSVTFAHVSAPLTGNVTGDVSGNAGTATALQNSRTISLAGDLSGSVSFNGTSDVTITASVEPNSVALGTDTTGNYVNDVTAGTGVTVTHTPGEGSSPTIAIGQAVGTSSSVTFAHVSAPITGNVTGDLTGNVTGNVSGNAGTATALQNSRAISLGGDLSGSVSFNGTSDVTITATVQPNSVALGTDTTGNYMSDVTAGTGVTVTHTPGEASSATVAIGQAVGTSDNPSFAGVTADAVQIGISAAGEIDTTSGNLTIDSAGGTVTVDDNLIVSGDLTVNGTTTTVNTETINLADNQIVLNSNETGSPSQNAGLEIERGTSANVALRWNETSDKWELTEDGTTYVDIATVSYVDAQTINSLDEIGDVSTASAASGDFLKYNGSAWVNDPINLGTDTVGNYINDITAGTGVTVTHTPGEGSSPTVAIGQAVGTSSSVTFAAVTAPLIGNASTATTLATSRTIELTGDVTGSVSFNGSANASITASIAANSVALGTDTTGNYMSGITAGTGLTVSHTPGEGSSASVSLNATLDNLSDVSASAAASGEFLKYLATSEAVPGTGAITWTTRTSNFGNTLINSVAYGNGVWAAGAGNYGGSYGALATSTDGATWVIQISGNEFDPIRPIRSVAYGNNLWVAGGQYGQLRTSTDAVTWTTQTSNFGNSTIRLVAYGNNLWVAGGDSEIRTSTDGTTWTTRTSTFGSYAIRSVAYGNNLWVAAGQYGGLRTSTDGTTWTTQTSNFGNTHIQSVAYGNSLWVAGGYTGQLRTSAIDVVSTSGWVPASVPIINALDDIGNVDAPSPSVDDFLKYDGTNWVPDAVVFPPSINALDDIADVNASSPTTGYFLKWDGTEWVPAAAVGAVTTTSITTASATEIYSFDPTVYGTAEVTLQVKQGSKKTSSRQLVNHNGTTASLTEYAKLEHGSPVIPATLGVSYIEAVTTWTTRTSNFGNSVIFSVAYGNNLWVAGGGYSSAVIRTSTDAITWVTQTSNFGNTIINSVAYGNTLWVASGRYGQLRTSTDAVTWTTRTSNFGNTHIQSVAYGNNLWVAGGQYGELRTSTDAITWTTRQSNFGIYGIQSVAYGNNLWFAGGYGGNVRTSTDAITWVTRTSNMASFENIHSVAYGDKYVAAGGNFSTRKLITSTDSITWSAPAFFGAYGGGGYLGAQIYSVAYGNGLWIAGTGSGGYEGRIFTSTDAITWTTRTSNFGANDIKSVAYGNDLLVAGGYSGQLRTAPGSTKVSVTATITDANVTTATSKATLVLTEE
jgi:hypothetical protein